MPLSVEWWQRGQEEVTHLLLPAGRTRRYLPPKVYPYLVIVHCDIVPMCVIQLCVCVCVCVGGGGVAGVRRGGGARGCRMVGDSAFSY